MNKVNLNDVMENALVGLSKNGEPTNKLAKKKKKKRHNQRFWNSGFSSNTYKNQGSAEQRGCEILTNVVVFLFTHLPSFTSQLSAVTIGTGDHVLGVAHWYQWQGVERDANMDLVQRKNCGCAFYLSGSDLRD